MKIDLTPWITDMYVYTIKLWYIYLPKWKKQIFSKFKEYIIPASNIREKNIQGQTKSLFNLYKDSLKDMIDNNIDNRISDKNNFLLPSKPSILAFQIKKAILFLSRLFSNSNEAINNKDNNSNIFLLNNLLSKLL